MWWCKIIIVQSIIDIYSYSWGTMMIWRYIIIYCFFFPILAQKYEKNTFLTGGNLLHFCLCLCHLKCLTWTILICNRVSLEKGFHVEKWMKSSVFITPILYFGWYQNLNLHVVSQSEVKGHRSNDFSLTSYCSYFVYSLFSSH